MPWLSHSPSQTKVYVGKSLRKGPKELAQLSAYFHTSGYAVYMPYDDDSQVGPAEIKKKDLDALRACDVVVLEMNEASLGVAQELGAARIIGKPVVLITESEHVALHNWVRGDDGITVCRTKESALATLNRM